LQTIQNIPLEKLKFVDEAHVVSRELGTSKVLGLVGKRTYTRERTLNAPSASLTLLTSLVDEIPFFIDYRIQSNTQWDFADFLLLACEAGYLKKGDYLIMDNAAVHCGMESFEVVRSILDTFGVTVIKLPTYSPELNPVELVFSQTKRHIRIERCRNEPQNLCVEVLESLSAITRQHIYNYYMKCV
jgi:transposase